MKHFISIRFGIFAAVLLILTLVSVASIKGYRNLAGLQKNVDSRWSDVNKEYQSRTLLVSRLIQALSAVPNFDSTTFKELAHTQEKVDAIKLDPSQMPIDSTRFQQYAEAQQALTKALAPVLMTALINPSLKTNKSLQALEAGIIESENRLVLKQSRFDQVVQGYNTTVHSFPMILESTVLGFKPFPSFQAQETAVAVQSSSS